MRSATVVVYVPIITNSDGNSIGAALACRTSVFCYDAPQQNGQRTILIPADPVPIMNPRPEYYVPNNNPLSNLGASPNPFRPQDGSQMGTMTDAGGVHAAFDTNANKPDFMSCMKATALSSYQNYVGINWSGAPATTSSTLNPPVLTHTTVPLDQRLMSSKVRRWQRAGARGRQLHQVIQPGPLAK
jgi:glucose dehydrogenase